MNDAERDTLAEALQGRIIALEMMMTTYIVDHCSRTPSGDLLASIRAMRQVVFASAQNAERPADERTDRIWESSARSLDQMFKNALARAEGIVGRD